MAQTTISSLSSSFRSTSYTLETPVKPSATENGQDAPAQDHKESASIGTESTVKTEA